jgi:predicted CXXCH cytochrome family protein
VTAVGKTALLLAVVLLAVVLLAVVLLLSSCLNEGGYRIASFFFDGVPAPGEARGVAPGGEQAAEPARSEAGAPAPDAGASKSSPAPEAPPVFTHGPYAKGSCASCHDVGSSNALVKEGNDLCLTCHGTILTGKQVVHVAAAADCLICHAPHKSGVERLLVKSVPDLCLDCHMRDAVEKVHGEIADCRACHNPHESDSAALLEFK